MPSENYLSVNEFEGILNHLASSHACTYSYIADIKQILKLHSDEQLIHITLSHRMPLRLAS